jgi:hypothetical protein
MKTIFYLTFVMLIAVSACQDPEDFLDSKTDAALNETKVFSDSLLTIRFLVSVYQDAPFNFFKGRTSNRERE